jgi:hypothetical protein
VAQRVGGLVPPTAAGADLRHVEQVGAFRRLLHQRPADQLGRLGHPAVLQCQHRFDVERAGVVRARRGDLAVQAFQAADTASSTAASGTAHRAGL